MSKTKLIGQAIKVSAVAGLIAVGCAAAHAASAATVTFAQFQQNPATQGFVYTNTPGAGGTSAATFNTVAGGIPVLFEYSNIPNLPTDLQGVQNATLTMTGASLQSADQISQLDAQPFFPVTLIFTRNTPAAEGLGARTDLLTVTEFAILTGLDGGSTVSLTAPLGANLPTGASYTSDFLTLPSSNISIGEANQSFTSLNPSGLQFTPSSMGASTGSLSNFTAAGTGTFDIQTSTGTGPPVIPEPATLGIVGVGLACMLRRRSRSRTRNLHAA